MNAYENAYEGTFQKIGNPQSLNITSIGQIAQLVEQRTENPCVGGSIPPLATSNTKVLAYLRKQLFKP